MKAVIIFFLLLITRTVFCQSTCPASNASPLVLQPTGVAIVSTTCSTLVVKWQGSAGQTYCVNATYYNTAAKKKDTVVGSSPVCDQSQSCTATIPVMPGAQVTWSIQAIDNGSASYPVISVLENPIAACSGSGLSFCGKVLLQGAYDTTAKTMRNDLNRLGLLQSSASSQPYNAAPFKYTGTEKVGTGFFTAHPDIVDWVLVELTDPNAPSFALSRRAAFVKQDGTLVDTNGTSKLIYFPGMAASSYHVAIRHRNHLGVRTAVPIDFRCGSTCYDFTNGSFRSYKNQSYPSPMQMGSVWVMRGGDANVSRSISYKDINNDQNQILSGKLSGSLSRIIINVYAPEDVNMDGKIKWNGPGNDQNFLLNIVLSGILSALLLEQL